MDAGRQGDAPPPYTGFQAGGTNKGQFDNTPYPQPVGGATSYPPPQTVVQTAGYPVYPVYPATANPGAVVVGTTGVVTTAPVVSTVIVRASDCPRCHQGIMMEQFTCCGIFLAIIFFPIGLLCCFLLRAQRCSACGYTY